MEATIISILQKKKLRLLKLTTLGLIPGLISSRKDLSPCMCELYSFFLCFLELMFLYLAALNRSHWHMWLFKFKSKLIKIM